MRTAPKDGVPSRVENEAVIVKVLARQILDSRGNPTVEAEVISKLGSGRASVPSGASTGRHEALELRDGNAKSFHGKGVLLAVAGVVSEIGPRLKGVSVVAQREIDEAMTELDGTPSKSRLGANAILAVSMAAARAAANVEGVPLFQHLRKGNRYMLPVPMMNVVNGGEHAGNKLALQEFHVEPVGGRSCADAIRIGSEVYQSLRAVLKAKYGPSAVNVGDEGGFAPPLGKTKDALEAIRRAVAAAGYTEDQVRLGIDAAASTFYDAKRKVYTVDGRSMRGNSLEDFYASLADEYALFTLEDPFGEDMFEDFASITRRLGRRTQIIGDDLYVTNPLRIRKGVKQGATNGVLIKLNQVGTVSETTDAIRIANDAGWGVTVSHRSGETEDTFIAHLAVAHQSTFIKAGAPARGERTAKYNELLRIQELLGTRAGFAGASLGR